jgi:calcium permeable stress-gated cation channel
MTCSINSNSQPRYWSHLIVAYVLTGFVLWLMRRELLIFVHLRQQFLISKYHAKLAQAKTVLITSLPQELCDETALRQLFSFVPGGINHIWIYRNEPSLPDLHEERLELCNMLEQASTTLLQTAIKARIQQEKKTAKAKHKAEKGKGPQFPLGVTANADDEAFAGDLEKIGAEKLLGNLHRPKHRPGWIPFWGAKIDTIDYCINRLGELNEKIEAARKLLPECKPFGSCFIQCNLQIGAHVIAQCVSYHEPLFMSQRWIEVAPEDVVWRKYFQSRGEINLLKVP